MSSIFDRWSRLDPARVVNQVNTAAGRNIADKFSIYDPQKLMNDVRDQEGGTFSKWCINDPELMLKEIDAVL
jgi:hypothetical protein